MSSQSLCVVVTYSTLKAQEAVYSLLYSLQSELLVVLKDGALTKDVYQFALSYIRDKRPECER